MKCKFHSLVLLKCLGAADEWEVDYRKSEVITFVFVLYCIFYRFRFQGSIIRMCELKYVRCFITALLILSNNLLRFSGEFSYLWINKYSQVPIEIQYAESYAQTSTKVYFIIKRKFKQWWSTIPPISTKRTTTWRWNSRSWFATGKIMFSSSWKIITTHNNSSWKCEILKQIIIILIHLTM